MIIIPQQQCRELVRPGLARPELAGNDYFKGCVVNYGSLGVKNVPSHWKGYGPATNIINRLGQNVFFRIVNRDHDAVILTVESESRNGASYQFFKSDNEGKGKKELVSTISAIIQREEFIFALSHAKGNTKKVGSITIRAEGVKNGLTEELGKLCFNVITMCSDWFRRTPDSTQIIMYQNISYNNLHFTGLEEDFKNETDVCVNAILLSENYFLGCALSFFNRKKIKSLKSDKAGKARDPAINLQSDKAGKVRGPAKNMINGLGKTAHFKFSNLIHGHVNLIIECDEDGPFVVCEGEYKALEKEFFKKGVFKIPKSCEKRFFIRTPQPECFGSISKIKMTVVGDKGENLGELEFDVRGKKDFGSKKAPETIKCICGIWYNNMHSPVITLKELEDSRYAVIPEPIIPLEQQEEILGSRKFWQVI